MPAGCPTLETPVFGSIEATLGEDQDQVDGEVLGSLDERHRDPWPDLAVVVHPEPLVRGVTAACDHQLGSEQPPHGPRSEQHRHHDVETLEDLELGALLAHHHDGHWHSQDQATEGGETSLPDGDDLAGVVRVVPEVGEHVHRTSAHDGGDEHPEEEGGDPVGLVATIGESSLEVAVREPEGDREPDPVGVDLERPDVERRRDWPHGRLTVPLRGGKVRTGDRSRRSCPTTSCPQRSRSRRSSQSGELG